MERVKIELFRYETLVFGSVLEMDESLRCIEDIVKNEEFEICSSNTPALYTDSLYLRGGNTDRDKGKFSFDYPTEEEAISACENIKKLIEEINSKPKKEDEVKSEIIKVM
jgi:hypothetical protein